MKPHKGMKPMPIKYSTPQKPRPTPRPSAKGNSFWEQHKMIIAGVVILLVIIAAVIGALAGLGKLSLSSSSSSTPTLVGSGGGGSSTGGSTGSVYNDGSSAYSISPYSSAALCLTVPSNQRMNNNGPIQLQSCSGTDPKYSSYLFETNGALRQYYYSAIVNLIMNAAGGCAAGKLLVQENEDWEPSPAQNEIFSYSGTTNLLTTCQGMCIQPAGSVSAGSAIQLATCTGSTNQRWTLTKVSGVTPLNCNGFCTNVLYSFEAPNLRLTTTGFEQNPSGQPSQQDWTYTNNAGIAQVDQPTSITISGGGDTPDGQQYAYLTPGSSFSMGSTAFTAGASCTMRFSWGLANGATNLTPSNFVVTVAGQQVYSIPAELTGGWQQTTTPSFTLASTTGLVQFSLSGTGSGYVIVDSVQMTC